MHTNTMMPENHRPGRKNAADEQNIFYMLRVMNGLSMRELARYLHSNPNRICRMERGKSVKLKIIRAFSELFCVPVDDLLRNNIAAVGTAKNIGLSSNGGNKQKRRMLAQVENGELGEEITAGIERKKLAGTGYETCVSTKPAKNRRNGYDVISATEDGQSKYIEVKTTTSPDPNEPFHMTSAEYRKMKEFMDAGNRYELHRIFGFDRDTMKYKIIIYTPQQVIDLFEPVPESYRMVRKGADTR